MQVPSIPKIKEIFWSFQGEGLRAGVPSIFLRLAGCRVQCPYCDTRGAWDPGAGKAMPVENILVEVDRLARQYPSSQVVITGGEPLEQDISDLTTALKKKKYFLSIETNGLHFQDLPLDWWTVSPKDVTDYFIHENLVEKIAEIKLLVNKNLTLEVIRRIRGRVSAPIFLQPDGTGKNRYRETFVWFRRCQEEGITGIRAGVQLHKVYHVR